ncbi:MAG: LysE family transporter [Candidatus Auribacterota bacterium]|nr:LysE family transporter [Candidatus Auribacterota bacterium]
MLRILGVAFSLALTGAIAPGPVLVLVIGQVLAQGVWAAVYIMLGHALLESILILGLARGMKKLLDDRRVRSVLGMIGGSVLIWMGWDLFRQGGEVAMSRSVATVMSPLKLILAGVGVSLSNPYFTGWWATVGTGQFAALKLSSWKAYSVFFAGHELGDMAWYLFVAGVVMAGRDWLMGGAYSIILRISAVIILIFGVGFIVISLRNLIVSPKNENL